MSPEDLQSLSSVIDSKALLARCLNNLDFAERILALFENRGAVELAELDRALEAGDVETVSRIAHRLSGACANAAAVELQICASNLRTAANQNSLPDMSAGLKELHGEWQKFVDAMPAERVG